MSIALFKKFATRMSSTLVSQHTDEESLETRRVPEIYHLYLEDQFWGPVLDVQQAPEGKELVSEASSVTACNERPHFQVDPRIVSDAVIGLSDGLTVPFALTAGLSALGNTKAVIYGGLAELIAGAISMGLGGYLGAKSEGESYNETLTRTKNTIVSSPSSVDVSLNALFNEYELPEDLTSGLVAHLNTSPHLCSFMMRFVHQETALSASRALTCALTISLGYFVGGFVPLMPYFFVARDAVLVGLAWSIGIMMVALAVFGYVKTGLVVGWRGGRKVLRGLMGALQMLVVGSVAAGAAWGLVVGFDHMVGMSV